MKVARSSGRRTTDNEKGRTAEIHAMGSSVSGPRPKAGSWEFLKGTSGPSLKDVSGWAEGLYSLSPKVLGRGKEPEETIGPFKIEAHLGPLREPVPSRAPSESIGIFEALEQELLAVGSTNGKVLSLGRLKPTDEALLDEASKYPLHLKLPIFFLGFGVSSPSTPFLGPDGVVMGKVGVSSEMLGTVEGARRRDSLRKERLEVFSAHIGWNLSLRATSGGASGSELDIVPFGGGLESPLAKTMALQVEEGEGEEGWSSSCLAKFSRCLGMPTVGFKEEILFLLRRMRGRIEQKSQHREYKKKKSSASKSSRKLKKLEWTISYKRARVASNEGKLGGASGSGYK